MGSLFKAPKVKVPKPDTPTPAPTVDDAAKERTELDRLRRRRGLQSNIATGPLGAPINGANAVVKVLTGQ